MAYAIVLPALSSVIPLRVLGELSQTAPWNCAKTETLLNEAVAYLLKHDLAGQFSEMDGRSNLAALALLATGEKAHLEIARKRALAAARLIDESHPYPPKWSYATWGYAYANLLLTEYYLLTTDTAVLPAIPRLLPFACD